MSHLVDNDLDYFLCEDCGAAFSVLNHIYSTGYVKRTISPTNMLFRGVCTACGSPRIFADPAADDELTDEELNLKITGNKEGVHPWNYEDPADGIAPNENEIDPSDEIFERSAAYNDIHDMMSEMGY
jgi:hypothetical protein